MIENAIQKSEDYPTRMELWKSLPKQMQYQTFKLILDYLEIGQVKDRSLTLSVPSVGCELIM